MGLNLEDTELLRSALTNDVFDRACAYPLFLPVPLSFSSSSPVLQGTCTHINSFDTHVFPYHEQIRLYVNIYKLSVAGEKRAWVVARHWVAAEGSGGSAVFYCQWRRGGMWTRVKGEHLVCKGSGKK